MELIILQLGGATVDVGDPTNRLASRERQELSTRQSNTAKMQTQLSRLWSNVDGLARKHGHEKVGWNYSELNNQDWLSRTTLTEFLFTIGPHFRLGAMLSRETYVGLWQQRLDLPINVESQCKEQDGERRRHVLR